MVKKITYTIEKVKDNLEMIDKLSKLHYDEVAPYDDIPLNVNWKKYLRLEECGILKLYIARKDNSVIGYAVFFVMSNIDYQKSLQASLSNIFIHPKHRGRGASFILWCDDQLRELGVQVVYHHVKNKNDYGILLKRLGYERMNIEYSKRLDKE